MSAVEDLREVLGKAEAWDRLEATVKNSEFYQDKYTSRRVTGLVCRAVAEIGRALLDEARTQPNEYEVWERVSAKLLRVRAERWKRTVQRLQERLQEIDDLDDVGPPF